MEVYLSPFPDVEQGRRQISKGGGIHPLWSRDGRELFYRSAGRMMRVPVRDEAGSKLGSPEPLFDDAYLGAFGIMPGRTYDVTEDGSRFLMVKPLSTDEVGLEVVLVQNWSEELERLFLTN